MKKLAIWPLAPLTSLVPLAGMCLFDLVGSVVTGCTTGYEGFGKVLLFFKAIKDGQRDRSCGGSPWYNRPFL